jgi:hexosaminidase
VPLTRVALIVPLTTELDRPPALGDDEGFRLWVNATHGGEVHATTYSGLHRGLEAFAQLTIVLGDALVINSTTVHVASAPLFPYRGLMVDTARHFEPVPTLLQLLDGMAASSLNTFHWHLTDAQAFPWNSTAEPRLIQGAYRPDLTYQRADLEAIVAFAADRAIRVVVEIDMPGHAASWAIGRPDVVVDCPPDNSAPLFDGSYQSASQLDPSTNATFELLDALIGELVEIFPDKFMHFGGDEVRGWSKCVRTVYPHASLTG